MPVLRMQDDGSIGAALGQLATGLGAINDPTKLMQAEYLGQQVAASRASMAKTQLETRQLQGQLDAQGNVVSSFGSLLDQQNPAADYTMAPDVQGPRVDPQSPFAQHEDAIRQAKLNFAKRMFANAASRGGNPLDALKMGPMGLGLSDIMLNGAPTDEQAARSQQAMLTGQLPDAKTPLTDAGRQQITSEDIAKQNAVEDFKQGVTPLKLSPTESALLPKRVAPKFGVPLDGNGQAYIAPRMDSNPTEDRKNYEFYAVQARQQGKAPMPFEDYQTMLRRAGAQTAETAENQTRGKMLAEDIMGQLKGANMAADHSQTLDAVEQLMGNVDTGKATQLLEALRQRTGLTLDPNTDRVQALNAIISKLIPQMRPAGAGSTSDFEEKLYAQGLMGLGNTAGGNKMILDSLRRTNQLSLLRGKIATDYASGAIDGATATRALGELRNRWTGELRGFGIDPVAQGGAQGGAPAGAQGAAPGPRRLRVGPDGNIVEVR